MEGVGVGSCLLALRYWRLAGLSTIVCPIESCVIGSGFKLLVMGLALLLVLMIELGELTLSTLLAFG